MVEIKVKRSVINLFPTPVYLSTTGIKLTEKELDFVNKTKEDFLLSTGNTRSKDSYILENEEFLPIKKVLEKEVEHYFETILKSAEVKPYITQSWLNYTQVNQYHHPHHHPNSLVSGVFYIDADKYNDKISFIKPNYGRQLELNVTEYNDWNSQSWVLPTETGDLFLFPSTLEHNVDFKKGTNTRISLAFNVFVKGILGHPDGLNFLKI